MIARTYGYSNAQRKAVNAASDPQKWFAAQLKPTSISDTKADQLNVPAADIESLRTGIWPKHAITAWC